MIWPCPRHPVAVTREREELLQHDISAIVQATTRNSVAIVQELERLTKQMLIAFRPRMMGIRNKLQSALSRITTLQEHIAYSLFGIFRTHLPVIYGEEQQNTLGRILHESSSLERCLPADIVSYKFPPCMPLSLSEDEMQTLVSTLQNIATVESALKLYTILGNLSAPRFATFR
ncbi:uncharacterized protein EDB93DRAFT_654064 [Suillus bovinus]|uniref:uncharacterized protein n=1 Tax=Suillus bovinus TaxID=48563 RepID=UPI001B873DE4|nr:uncharacterized protein EDB93DRAFT_654064 [Suillus bovinus]KAG2158208.1 hypothetical protein EDB93DRAFT_654064 [Suillus bovinus]